MYAICPALSDFKRQRLSLDADSATRIEQDYLGHVYHKRPARVKPGNAYKYKRGQVLKRVRQAQQAAAAPAPPSPSSASEPAEDSMALHVRMAALERELGALQEQSGRESETAQQPVSSAPAVAFEMDFAGKSPLLPPSSPSSSTIASAGGSTALPHTRSLLLSPSAVLAAFAFAFAPPSLDLSQDMPDVESAPPPPLRPPSATTPVPLPCAGCDAWRAMYEQLQRHTNPDEVAATRRRLSNAERESKELEHDVGELRQQAEEQRLRVSELEQDSQSWKDKHSRLMTERREWLKK